MGKEQSDALMEEARVKLEEMRTENICLVRDLKTANLHITELTLDMDAMKLELSEAYNNLTNLRLEHQEMIDRG